MERNLLIWNSEIPDQTRKLKSRQCLKGTNIIIHARYARALLPWMIHGRNLRIIRLYSIHALRRTGGLSFQIQSFFINEQRRQFEIPNNE